MGGVVRSTDGVLGVMERPRAAFDGRRQRDALTAYQKRAGLDATTAAKAVHLSYPQYNRYLWGSVPLRTDQIRLFADAYGIAQADLTRALGLMDEASGADQAEPWNAPGWTFRGHLHGKVPDADIERFADEHEGKPLASQYSAAEGILRLAVEQIDQNRSIS